VEDHGAGIPAAEMPQVFSWYFRGSNVAEQVAGSGIGLAGARQIVEQHGGTIGAESREGEGSTFTVRLPLHAPGASR
jgi:signal transduction histidine kinase